MLKNVKIYRRYMQYIAENNIKGHAAVCGKYAAELYGLNILDEDIQTNKRNFTRFLVVLLVLASLSCSFLRFLVYRNCTAIQTAMAG